MKRNGKGFSYKESMLSILKVEVTLISSDVLMGEASGGPMTGTHNAPQKELVLVLNCNGQKGHECVNSSA